MASTTPRGLFETKDYKQYLIHRFGDKSERRGIKSKAATAIGCQATYLSQVLHGHAHLSLEQADALNAFFSHSKAEADYFLLLVQRAKAGTPSLRKHFDEQLEHALAKRLHLVSRQGGRTPLNRDTTGDLLQLMALRRLPHRGHRPLSSGSRGTRQSSQNFTKTSRTRGRLSP